MPTITIDDTLVDVPDGATVLEAARQLGIEIPTLCYLEGYKPSTSCQVCLVKDLGTGRFVPSCGTRVVEGMQIASETAEVHRVRRWASRFRQSASSPGPARRIDPPIVVPPLHKRRLGRSQSAPPAGLRALEQEAVA